MGSKATPRGVRNSNPGNIDRSGTPWLGEDRSAAARQSESRFCVFVSADFGFRALAKILLTYRSKHGLRTINAMIHRWAPPVENDTAAYVAQVSRAAGLAPDADADITHPDTMFAIVKAIAKHENGGMFWTDDTIKKGIALAGVRRD